MPAQSEEELPLPSPQPGNSEDRNFHSQYKVIRTIGHGTFAKVLLAQHRLTGTSVAIKVLVKNKPWFQEAMKEANILKKIKHPNIVSLLQVIETKTRGYLILELVEGQELYEYIKTSGHIEEDKARQIFIQILSAVGYCHGHGIVHRDLKPDNIMIDNKGNIKIIDFGLSTQFKPGEILKEHCGAYAFGAPERFLGQRYDGTKSDLGALGVVLHYMVVGKVPFDSFINPELQRQVVAGVYPAHCGVSKELEDLLSRLMTVIPKYRPTATEVMKHPWLKGHWKGLTDIHEEPVPVRPDPDIVDAMQYIGFRAKDIRESLTEEKFNEMSAAYYLLERQALQREVCSTQAPTVSQVKAPFPSIDVAGASCLKMKKSGSAPILGRSVWPSSIGQVPAYGQKVRQRAGSRSTGHGLLFRPHQMTPTQDQHHIRAMSVPCMLSTSSISEQSMASEKREEIILSHSALAEDKPIPSRGWRRGIMQ
jgi:serine/threonine protein kinase